ncbi:hypothetical protein [Siphonobacter sp. SORGH_AS_1065]|uniref:hypothetical protein n=1 Tax=Siphonobacter sp. SORGH_AS_1065 TaxID=3041795 RepID=UPI0027892951|nr:hypothetical protein [Siphonobacter sp. SORGH_AS_1065]MDQ1087395.1 hypothetical protein [Siphonobacter sp. SORGH_AS_1065]
MVRTELNHTAQGINLNPTSPSLWNRFIAFCDSQEVENHWLWAGATVAIQGCILTPLLLWTINHFGLGDGYLLVAVISIFSVVVPNLSALSTKIILPIFATSFLIHVGIILSTLLTHA